MEPISKETERSQQARPDKSGIPTFAWQITHTSVIDTVKLVMPPDRVLPIVFVPGIMGSNLCTLDRRRRVWLLDSTFGQPLGLAWEWARKGPGARQSILHPSRTTVFPNGSVPKEGCGTIQDASEYIARGWGEVGETSYHEFLLWLERKLNSEGFNPSAWNDFSYESVSSPQAAGGATAASMLYPNIPMKMQGLPELAEKSHKPLPVVSDELIKRSKFRFPVYACGYNWLASNKDAAKKLKVRVEKIISENNRGRFKCKQVILVTHSMGGLVARACAQMPGMTDKIAGVVHGVMPAIGAAVAYRRCKVGMGDEDFAAGLVIGSTGQEVTAVFAQAPGALQLLPSEDYGAFWLQFRDRKERTYERKPQKDPYSEIYLQRNQWWGLVREEWLSPLDGTPILWEEYEENIMLAREFHRELSGKFHPQTYVFYGAGVGKEASFEKIRWTFRRTSEPRAGTDAFSTQNLADCEFQDGCGDGTVPESSGMAPRERGGEKIRQQFRLTGFSHEPAYKNKIAQIVTYYAITKIAALADLS